MKTINLSAAAIAVALSSFAVVSPAFAQDAPAPSAQGHYEWRQSPNYGPRAPFTAPRRVWVPDAPRVASCDCAMMQGNAADCMRGVVKPNKG